MEEIMDEKGDIPNFEVSPLIYFLQLLVVEVFRFSQNIDRY